MDRYFRTSPGEIMRYKQVGLYRLALDPGDLNDRLYYFDLTGHAYTTFVRRILQPGMTVIDVGANVGHFSTTCAAQVGQLGHVYAIEANPHLVRRLKTCAAEVPDGPLRIEAAAVWREPGVVTLHIDHQWSGWSSLSMNETLHSDETVVVPAITLTDFVQWSNIGRVRLLKMDVKGAEIDALYGAANWLHINPPDYVIVEAEPYRMKAFGYTGNDLERHMREAAYVPIGAIENDRLRALTSDEAIPGQFNGDYVYVQQSLLTDEHAIWHDLFK